jgi:hypothetical protein
MSRDGARPWHDVDRALTELLQEMRIAQMGGQISLGFLLAVAYTSAIRSASEADRSLFTWAVGVTTSALVLLLAPVPLHRMNFGQRARRRILVVGHVLALVGLAALAGAIVLTVWLAARIAVPGAAQPLVLWTAALVAGTWLVLPLAVRLRDDRERSSGVDSITDDEPRDRLGI